MKRTCTIIPPLRRIMMLSVHSSPLAALGGQDTGGMNVYVRELSRHLADGGVAVDVYTRRQDPCQPPIVNFGSQARVIHLTAGPPAPYTKYRLWDHLPEFVRGVQTFIESQHLSYNIVHSHYWLSGWVALQLRRALRIPVVHMSHTLGYPKNAVAQPSWEQEPLRRLQVERDVLWASDGLVAESPASQHHMMQDYGIDPAKVQIIPCGVDITRFHPHDQRQARQRLGLPDTSPIVLFVGRLQPLKGIDILLRAAQLVRQHHPDLCVLVVGGGVDEHDAPEAVELERLRGLSAQLGLAPHVRFIKAQPQETLVQYYAAADMLVMPSYYESFGMVVLEAMACGTPVVASNVGGLASTVVHERTGVLVPAGDWQAFAQAMLRLFATPAWREALRHAGVEHAQTYAWPAIVKRTWQFYRRLMCQYTTRCRELATVCQPPSPCGASLV